MFTNGIKNSKNVENVDEDEWISTDETHMEQIKDSVLKRGRITFGDLADASGSANKILKGSLDLKCAKFRLLSKRSFYQSLW